MNHTYNVLFLVALSALLSPWLSNRLFKAMIPAVIIEILLGILIGPQGLDIAYTTPDVEFLAAFGFAYLMFLSGLELDFDLLTTRSESRSRPPWVRGLLFFAITVLLSFVLALILHQMGFIRNTFVVTLILSTTSVGIVTPALKEKGWISAPFGQEVMLYALIADIATLVLFTGYIAIHTTGNAFSIILVMIILLIFVVLYRLLRLARRFHFIKIVENATSEIGLRGSFTLILAFLALSQILGTEVVIGAFLAGATISLLSEKHSLLSKKLNSIGYGFLLPVFFVNVGMKFNMHALAGSPLFWTMLGILLIGMFANKVLPAALFLRHFSLRHRLAGGFLLSSRLSLLIAASQIAAQTGILSETMENGFILLAIVTCFLSPLLFSREVRHLAIPTEKHQEKQSLTIDKSTIPEGWILDQIEVRSRALHERAMRDLNLPQDALVVSIVRDEECIVPRGRTNLQQFDIVQIMGDPDAIRTIRTMFSQS